MTGHDVGDRILIEVTSFFDSALKGYVFRIGGEEFAILPDARKVHEFADMLREHSNIHNIDEQAINLTISIGVAYSVPNQT